MLVARPAAGVVPVPEVGSRAVAMGKNFTAVVQRDLLITYVFSTF
jgi:hypothetical protein